MTIEIIERREEITPAWLTATLAAAGVKATVVDIAVEPIIAGYFGCSSRLAPRYAESDPSLPTSFFLKMATSHESARRSAADGGMYRFEVGFYQQLASWVNVSTPRCYAAEISDDNATFVLLLADAAPLRQADQLQGLSLEQGRLAVQELAGLHASTWQGKGMADCSWAMMDETTADGHAEALVQLKPAFIERFGSELSSADLAVLDRLTDASHAYWRYTLESPNPVAVHCDFRADNMLFGERDGEPAMVTIDWVGTLNCGGRDLSHFLGTSLLPEARRAHEAELLSHYHETLLAQGVTGFSLPECIDDYRRNLLYPVFVVVSATASVDVDARGQKLFLSMFQRSCDAIRESNALELLESL